jgi:hypothetical protein
MRLEAAHLDQARAVADAILYEGYLLYPYRQSAQKNQSRFQFGVLMPPAYRAVDDCERSASQTECLLECPDDAEVLVLLRFLQLQRRTVRAASPDDGEPREVAMLAVDGTEFTAWDEAVPREQRVAAPVSRLLGGGTSTEFHIGAGENVEDVSYSSGRPAGQLVRRWGDIDGVIGLSAERVAGPFQALRLRLEVANHTAAEAPLHRRDDGLAHALIAAHALIGVPGGVFLSMTDPPEWAAAEVAACANVGTWPVLAGPEECRSLMLSSPVILYDHPEIAAESAGDLFDATEIDEILTLRTLALTDAEKREARATDPRAAELIDRLDTMPPEMLERMHGAIRYLRSAPAGAPARPGASEPPARAAGQLAGLDLAGLDLAGGGPAAAPGAPWWDPGSDTSVSPGTDHVIINGVRVARGSRVLMRPGARRSDAQDLFLIGREALVEAVLQDVDGNVHVALTPVDDPAADLNARHGRFRYFAPDEIEPIDASGRPDGPGPDRDHTQSG